MRAQQNKAVVQAFVDAVNAQDWAKMAQLIDPHWDNLSGLKQRGHYKSETVSETPTQPSATPLAK